jgi:hypothetical protein
MASGDFSIADVIEYESEHLGEFGNYRILFAGLSEVDDPEIRAALARVYKDFHTFIKRQLEASQGSQSKSLEASLAAWAIIGLGTVSTIGRETGCIGPKGRRRLIKEGGQFLAEGGTK